MSRGSNILLAAGLAVALSVPAFAQTTKKTETQTETKTSANGKSSTTKKTVTVTESTYIEKVRGAYVTAGVPQDKIDRLIELDRQIYAAYSRGDYAEVRRLRIEERKLLGDEYVPKVYTAIEALPADIVPIASVTYLPATEWQTTVIDRPTGTIDVGVAPSGTVVHGSDTVVREGAPVRSGTVVREGGTAVGVSPGGVSATSVGKDGAVSVGPGGVGAATSGRDGSVGVGVGPGGVSVGGTVTDKK